MAISLEKIQKKRQKNQRKKSKAKPNIGAKTTTVREKKQVSKPWQTLNEVQKLDFVEVQVSSSKYDSPLLLELSAEDQSLPHKEEQAEQSLLSLVYSELQKRSYMLSRIQRTLSWINSVKLYPKVEIPVPKRFYKYSKI